MVTTTKTIKPNRLPTDDAMMTTVWPVAAAAVLVAKGVKSTVNLN